MALDITVLETVCARPPSASARPALKSRNGRLVPRLDKTVRHRDVPRVTR
jgi:hypothetical protein